ncbi:MAG: hypothetical protein OXN81_06990 [Alphaproteobacteria bacterium]|nr:hypothetical protein [Alphaproteobacteria bacterium]
MGTESPNGGGEALGAEHRWEERVRDGLAAFDAGRVDEAYAAWRSAAAMTKAFAANDPRRAASRTHLALCHAAGDDAQKARRAFRRALQAWDAAEAWVARMALPQRARSSGFHLRLRAKHPGGYDAIGRAEFAKLLGAGRAAALAGSAYLARNPAAPLEEAQAQRAAGLSWREASQVAIWRALAALREEAGDGAAALDARQRADGIERDPVSFGPERLATGTAGETTSDLRRLEAAVYLSPVVLRRRR